MSEGRQLRGVTTCPRSAQWQRVPGCDGTGMAERSYPTSKVRGSGREEQLHVQGAVDAQAQEGLGSYPTLKVRKGSSEEIPLFQGKRNPSKMVGVARGHQKADTLKPYSLKSSQSNHTRITALSNSMKLSHAQGATQDGKVMVERSDRKWSTGEGNGKALSILALRTP